MVEDIGNEITEELKEAVNEEVKRNLRLEGNLWKSLVGRSVCAILESDLDKKRLQIPSTKITEQRKKFDIVWVTAIETIIEDVIKKTEGKFKNQEIQKEIEKQLKELLDPDGKVSNSIIGSAIYNASACEDYLLGKLMSTSEGLRPVLREDVKEWLE